MAQAVLAMRSHYAELYGVEELSAQLGVSKSHLVRAFAAEMGMGPGHYLTQVRLQAAKLLLARRPYPLELVASLCGFSGANYFCRVFRRSTGLTPAAWRRANRGACGSRRTPVRWSAGFSYNLTQKVHLRCAAPFFPTWAGTCYD
ncbi:MAG: AraC family transcriptional regulator [Ruthenibacterium lactatiformans]